MKTGHILAPKVELTTDISRDGRVCVGKSENMSRKITTAKMVFTTTDDMHYRKYSNKPSLSGGLIILQPSEGPLTNSNMLLRLDTFSS